MASRKKTEQATAGKPWTLEEMNRHEWPAGGPPPPWSVLEAATAWGIDASRVKQLLKEDRVPHIRKDGRGTRAGSILILSPVRPERLAPSRAGAESRPARSQ